MCKRLGKEKTTSYSNMPLCEMFKLLTINNNALSDPNLNNMWHALQNIAGHVGKSIRNASFKVLQSVWTSPTSGGVIALNTGRLEVPGSNSSRAYRPSRLDFSMVFSETRLNTD